MRLLLRNVLTVIGTGCLCAGVKADLTFGGNARTVGMGGAGLAIVSKDGQSTLDNPASLALLNRKMNVQFPHIGLHASGIPLGKALDHLTGNPGKNDAPELARDFGEHESQFGAEAGWGIRFGHLDVRVDGVARVHLKPNGALSSWAKNANGDVSQLITNPFYTASRADLFGAAVYSLPSIGFAERISPAGSPIRVEGGIRAKLMRAYYTHYTVDANSIALNGSAASAPELNGANSLSKTGFGMDLGILVHPSSHAGFSGALVVTDLFEPDFKFNGTDTVGSPTQFDLQPRSISLGTAYESGRLLAAADVTDVTRAYSNTQGRFGLEYSSRRFAVRGGYNTAGGFNVGLGLGSFDIAFGGRVPLQISEFMRF